MTGSRRKDALSCTSAGGLLLSLFLSQTGEVVLGKLVFSKLSLHLLDELTGARGLGGIDDQLYAEARVRAAVGLDLAERRRTVKYRNIVVAQHFLNGLGLQTVFRGVDRDRTAHALGEHHFITFTLGLRLVCLF